MELIGSRNALCVLAKFFRRSYHINLPVFFICHEPQILQHLNRLIELRAFERSGFKLPKQACQCGKKTGYRSLLIQIKHKFLCSGLIHTAQNKESDSCAKRSILCRKLTQLKHCIRDIPPQRIQGILFKSFKLCHIRGTCSKSAGFWFNGHRTWHFWNRYRFYGQTFFNCMHQFPQNFHDLTLNIFFIRPETEQLLPLRTNDHFHRIQLNIFLGAGPKKDVQLYAVEVIVRSQGQQLLRFRPNEEDIQRQIVEILGKLVHAVEKGLAVKAVPVPKVPGSMPVKPEPGTFGTGTADVAELKRFEKNSLDTLRGYVADAVFQLSQFSTEDATLRARVALLVLSGMDKAGAQKFVLDLNQKI